MDLLGRLFAPEEKPVRAKLIRNVLFSVSGKILAWPIPFLLIPFILGKLGVAGYGTWAILVAAISLTSLADMGIGGTLTKHVAEYYARKDGKALSRLLVNGLGVYSVVGVVLALVLSGCSRWVVPALFRGSPASYGELHILWLYLSVTVAINMVCAPFTSAIVGLQRNDLSNVLSSVTALFSASLTVLLLHLGLGLRGLVYANLSTTVLGFVFQVLVVRSLLPTLKLELSEIEWDQIRSILTFGLRLYFVQVAGMVHNQVEKLYLGLLGGSMIPVGWYGVASDTALKVRGIPELLLAPVMAAASELDAKGDREKLSKLYYRCHKYLAFVGVPLVFYVAAVSSRLVRLWLGPGLAPVAFPLAVLALVQSFNLLSGPGWLMLIGQGFLKPGVFSATVGIVLNVIVSFFLIYFYGFSGAVVGTAAAFVSGTAIFIYLFHRHTGYSYWRLIREAYLKPVACSALLVAVLRALHPLEQTGWAGLAAGGSLFGLVYLVLLFGLRFFDSFDLAQLEGLVPAARVVARMIPLA